MLSVSDLDIYRAVQQATTLRELLRVEFPRIIGPVINRQAFDSFYNEENTAGGSAGFLDDQLHLFSVFKALPNTVPEEVTQLVRVPDLARITLDLIRTAFAEVNRITLNHWSDVTGSLNLVNGGAHMFGMMSSRFPHGKGLHVDLEAKNPKRIVYSATNSEGTHAVSSKATLDILSTSPFAHLLDLGFDNGKSSDLLMMSILDICAANGEEVSEEKHPSITDDHRLVHKRLVEAAQEMPTYAVCAILGSTFHLQQPSISSRRVYYINTPYQPITHYLGS